MSSKLREALAEMVEYAQFATCHNQDAHVDHYLSQIIAWGKKALNEPLRNCDVGTAEEQTARALEYCSQFPSKDGHCVGCPLDDDSNSLTSCVCRWSQMPYESEVK